MASDRWVGFVRDLWAKPPFRWRQVRLFRDLIEMKTFATELSCLEAVRKRYREVDAHGNCRYSRVAVPEGERPDKIVQDAEGP